LIFYIFSYGFLGGDVAGNARKELENKTGKSIISSENFKQIGEKKQKKLK